MNTKSERFHEQPPTGNGGPLRAFIAFPLPGHMISRIVGIQEELATLGITAKWVKPENIHLTVKFLGDMEPALVPDVGRAVERAADGMQPLKPAAKGIGVFPNLRRPNVIWIGLGGELRPLSEFHARLETGLRALGFPPEKRIFSPHLTIGRFKKRINLKTLAGVVERFETYGPEGFAADRIILYRSRLLKTGPVYSELFSCPFGTV